VSGSANGAVILLVEDQAEVREMFEEALVALGFKTLVAGSADAALALLETVSPDVVLTDVAMPGMSGIELTARLKADPRFHFTPVVILTAVADLGARVAGLSAGADDFFPKPANLTELQARLGALVKLKRLHDELNAKNALLGTLLSRYVSKDVAREISENPGRYPLAGGEKRLVTVLFCDLVGFTPLAESLDPADVVEILNAYLAPAIDAVFECGGTVDKLLGDAVMAVFGAPVAHEDHPLRAVRSALAIQDRLRHLALPRFPGLRLQAGIGINTGVVVIGNIGSASRMDYTVIGNEVNVAKRLESNAGPGQILITDSTYAHVRDQVRVRPLGELRVKGQRQGVPTYDVLALA
jgi:adenylate cyclase